MAGVRGHWTLLSVTGLLTVVLTLWMARTGTVQGASTKPSSTTTEALATSSGSETARLEKKLSQILTNQEKILENQQTIFQRFDAVMEQLRIIKVRSTT